MMIFNGENDPLIKQFESEDSSDPALKPVKQVNQYLLVHKLGQGAFAKVYLAINTETGKKFAAKKFCLGELQRVENGVSQLEREVSLMRRYQHNNILKLHEVLHDKKNDVVYLIIDYADCGSLEDLISNPIPLDDAIVRSIFFQVLQALKYLHSSGMVHQDIKPSNILVNSDGKVVLADFGVGHSFQSTEMVVGSPAYQAPEALTDGDNGITTSNPAKEDVWSLGITLYQTEYLELPYTGENVFEIIRTIKSSPLQIPEGASPEIEDLIKGMLAVDPNLRLSVDEILHKQFFMDFKEIVPLPNHAKNINTVISPETPIKHIDAIVNEGIASFVRLGLTSVDLIRSIEEEKQKLIEEPELNDVPLERHTCPFCSHCIII